MAIETERDARIRRALRAAKLLSLALDRTTVLHALWYMGAYPAWKSRLDAIAETDEVFDAIQALDPNDYAEVEDAKEQGRG